MKTFPVWLIMIYQRIASNVKYVQDNCEMIQPKKQLLKQLHILVRSMNKIDNEPGDWIYGGCKNL